MKKFQIDFEELKQSVVPDGRVPLKGNEHRLVRVAFDLYRFKEGNVEELWQVQSSDDGEFLVRTYDLSDEEEKKAEYKWMVELDKKGENLTIAYRNIPLSKIAVQKYGIKTAEEVQTFQRAIYSKLNTDEDFTYGFVNKLSSEKQELLKEAGFISNVEVDPVLAALEEKIQKTSGFNFEALDILRKIERAENALKSAENTPLMELAVITSNSTLFREYMSKINSIKQEIKTLEEQLIESRKNFEQKKSEKKLVPENKNIINPVKENSEELDKVELTPLEEFDFADDNALAALEEKLSKKAVGPVLPEAGLKELYKAKQDYEHTIERVINIFRDIRSKKDDKWLKFFAQLDYGKESKSPHIRQLGFNAIGNRIMKLEERLNDSKTWKIPNNFSIPELERMTSNTQIANEEIYNRYKKLLWNHPLWANIS